MKKYTFIVTLHEGHDEFWEELERYNKTGCEEVKQIIINALSDSGVYDYDVSLTRFEDDFKART